MNYKLISALVLSAIALPCDAVHASADIESHAKKAPAKVVVLKLSDLRSAYLLRARVVRYDDHATASDQLRRHFNTVLGLLLYSTRQSIEVALDRLESSREESWSVDERTVWRQRLLEHRYQQIQRLALYRE